MNTKMVNRSSMCQGLSLLLCLVGGGVGFAAEPVLTVPAGFSIELVAGPPMVERPITVAFDEDGRLYVAESSGSNDPVEKQLELRPHRIVRLEDVDGDGKYDRRIGVCRPHDVSRRDDVPRRILVRVGAAEHLEAYRYRWRRRGGRAGRMVPGQDADRLRERSARAVFGAGWLDLLVQRRVRRADAPGERPRVDDAGCAHLSLPAGRFRVRAGDDRRHG